MISTDFSQNHIQCDRNCHLQLADEQRFWWSKPDFRSSKHVRYWSLLESTVKYKFSGKKAWLSSKAHNFQKNNRLTSFLKFKKFYTLYIEKKIKKYQSMCFSINQCFWRWPELFVRISLLYFDNWVTTNDLKLIL